MSRLPPPAHPLPGSSPPPAPTAAPTAELGTPADPTKVEGTEPPAVIDTLAAPATTTKRSCGYPGCDKVMGADQACDLHEQICAGCGVVNVRTEQKCTGCGAFLPTLPIVLTGAKPAASPAASTVATPAPAAPAPSSQAPVSGSVTLPPVTKPAGLSAVEDILDAAEEPEAVRMVDPPPPPPATPEEKAKEWLDPPKEKPEAKGKPAADTVKVPPLDPPRLTRVEEPEASAPTAEKEPARKSRLLAALAGMGGMMRLISLIFILIILGGLALHHSSGFMRMHNPPEPKVVEKVVIREVPAACPAPAKVEKAVPAKPVKKVSKRRSRPAAEKEITFKAEDLVHVWTGPVDHLLDKDDD